MPRILSARTGPRRTGYALVLDLDGYKNGTVGEPFADLKEFQAVQASLGLLADLPTARLERAFTEHLDLASYRLDAWKQGLIHKKLESLRFRQDPGENMETLRDGIYVGAFGWLEDLRPSKTVRENVSPEDVPEAFGPGTSPLQRNDGNAGFIHGPSLNHAVTAAVLRNAYLTHSGETDADLMSVNLSSERVRTALWLIEGIRQGQGLAELLGYQFERGLHDRHEMAEVDKFIYPLRKAFPLVADRLKRSGPDVPITALESSNVMNGVALIDHIQSVGTATYPFDRTDLENATSDEAATINAEVDRLRDALDAVGDLGMAESVYQLVQGNSERAAAVTDALSNGHVPPIPEIVDTPRSGFSLTHRCLLLFDPAADGGDPANNPWHAYGVAHTPRSAAEPGVNLWLAAVLPEPDRIVVRAQWSTDGGSTQSARDVRITDLGFQPIDLVHILGLGARAAAVGTEMDDRIAYFVRQAEAIGDSTNVEVISTERDESWAAKDVTLFELTPLLEPLRAIVTEPRALGGMDLILPGDDTDDAGYSSGRDSDEFATRARALRDTLSALHDTLQSARVALEAGSDEDEAITDAVRDAMVPLAAFAVPKAIPQSAVGASATIRTNLIAQANRVLTTVESKLESCDATLGSISSDMTIDQTVNLLADASGALLGADFTMLPVFSPNNPGALVESFASSEYLVNSAPPPLPVEDWLNGVARVRGRMALWEQTALMSDNFDRRALQLDPVQLPYQENDAWLAIEFPDDYALSGEKLVLAVHQGSAFEAPRPMKGVVLDEWVEVVPGNEETTGVAFHYDQPNAEAPQTMLLVVPPAQTGSWKWHDLTDALSETLDMAKQRGVEPAHVDRSNYAQLLPAVLVAFTTAAMTISTRLTSNLGSTFPGNGEDL